MLFGFYATMNKDIKVQVLNPAAIGALFILGCSFWLAWRDILNSHIFLNEVSSIVGLLFARRGCRQTAIYVVPTWKRVMDWFCRSTGCIFLFSLPNAMLFSFEKGHCLTSICTALGFSLPDTSKMNCRSPSLVLIENDRSSPKFRWPIIIVLAELKIVVANCALNQGEVRVCLFF